MEIINKLVNLLPIVRYQNKGYDLLSVNNVMGVMLGLPITHCSHPNINLHCMFIFPQNKYQ